MKKHIPNTITLLNLASGIIALLFSSQNQLEYAAYFVILGIIFDFFDGFFARILQVKSDLGLQLDSLADMVTSGVAPGFILFQLLLHTITDESIGYYLQHLNELGYLPFVSILIPLGAAYRLANFNIDTRQTTSFIGLPTPALTLFIISLPLLSKYGTYQWAMDLVTDSYFLVVVSLLGSIMMNSKFSLFSLKISDYKSKENRIKYLFIIGAAILLVTLQVTAIPLIILFYITLSVLNNLTNQSI